MIARHVILTDHKVQFTEPGPTAEISNATIPVLATAINAIKADALEEAAAEMRAATDFQNLPAGHQGGIVLALGELHRRAAALRSTEKGNTNA